MHFELEKLVCPRVYKAAVLSGLLMLIVGSVGFHWVKTDRDKENNLRVELDHLTAESIESINSVVAGRSDSEDFETINRKNEIQSQLELYENKTEKRELITIASFVAVGFSAVVIGGIFLLGIIYSVTKIIKKRTNSTEDTDDEISDESSQEHLLEIHNGDTEDEDDPVNPSEQVVAPLGAVLHKNRFASSYQQNRFMNSLYTDEKTEDCAVAVLESQKDNERSLKEYTLRLEKQVAEFEAKSKAAIKVQQEQTSEPIDGTLKELTAQVSAIREYASQQQDRVKKLQEGYDWNIIRTFCLKIIRCIDNIEFRMNEIGSTTESENLEDIKDELLFALESSGVEHYEPEIGSDYRGQEKQAEAVKTKVDSDDPEMKGKIAEVIRRGYEYVIDEENRRIVRPAQVKLFG